MGLTRNSTLHGELAVNDGRGEVRLAAIEVQGRKGPDSQVQGELESKAGRALSVPVFYHKNRDGSPASATGVPPAVWPEDEARG